VFITLSVLVGIYFNLGTRRPGSYSAYNIFNKGFKHLLGDLRGDQIEAELRNKTITNERDDDEGNFNAEQEGNRTVHFSKEANKLCACGSKKKTKKCCGSVQRDEQPRFQSAEDLLRANREKYQFLYEIRRVLISNVNCFSRDEKTEDRHGDRKALDANV
jgi:hypothetical protein